MRKLLYLVLAILYHMSIGKNSHPRPFWAIRVGIISYGLRINNMLSDIRFTENCINSDFHSA